MKGESWLARVAAIGAALSVAVAGLYRGSNTDTLGHLAQGRQILRLGYVPQVDTWSLLPGPPRDWHNYEWLSDLATYALYEKLGDGSVTLAKCSLLMIAVLCLARVAGLLAGSRAVVLASLTMVSTIPAIRARLSDRPHVIGICLAAAYLLLFTMLSQTARGRRSSDQPASDTYPSTTVDRRRCAVIVGTLFVLHLLWVNAHGSHLLGLCMTGSFLVLGSQQTRRWFAVVLGLQLLASCVSPYGPAISLDAIAHLADPRYRDLVTEWQTWQPDWPVWLQLGPALHGAVLTVLAPRLVRGAPAARSALPIAFVLGVGCFRSIRFLAEFMLLTSPLIGVGLAHVSASIGSRTMIIRSAASGLVLGPLVAWGCTQLPPSLGLGVGISFDDAPRAAGLLLGRHGVRPRVLASIQDSWATMFSAPNARFALDGRVPFYGPDHVAAVSRAFGDRAEFERLTRALDINVAIAAYAASGELQLAHWLAQRPNWDMVQIEDLHVMYVRKGTLDPVGERSHPPLRALRPSYGLDWILSADTEQREAIARELRGLDADPNTSGYRAFVRGVLALAPLRRGGPGDGFRWPRDQAEWATYRRVRPQIAAAASRALNVPRVAALEGAIDAIFCDFDGAREALERAMSEGPIREALLATQEIALREGRRDEVRRVVTMGRAMPQGKNDPWLAELARGLDEPPRCP